MLRRAQLGWIFTLLLIVAAGTWLRFSGLGEPGFWCDEAAYLYLDTQPPGAHHAHSHGFDLYVRCYARIVQMFGAHITDEFTFRLLPALLGTLAIAVMACAGVACGERVIGLFAALIYAVHPFTVAASRVATQYGSLLFFATLLMSASVYVLCDRRWWTWGVLVLASVFVFHLQIFASCIVIGTWLAVIMCGIAQEYRHGRSVAHFAIQTFVACVALIMLCLPEYAYYVWPMMRGTSVGNLQPSQQSLWQAVDFNALQDTLVSPHPWQRCLFYVLIMAGAAWSAYRVPVVITSAGSTTVITVIMLHTLRLEQTIGFPPRYVSFLLPVGVLMAGMGVWVLFAGIMAVLSWCGGRATRFLHGLAWVVVWAACVLFGLMQAGEVLYRRAYYPLTEWREMGEFLSKVVQPGDVILAGYDAQLLERYYNNSTVAIERITRSFDARDVTPQMMEKYMHRHTRVWSVVISGFVRWSGSQLPDWLDRTWIGLPFWSYGSAVHFWCNTEGARWSDVVVRRQKERELVEEIVRVAPGLYRGVRRLVELQMESGEEERAFVHLLQMMRQNPIDPFVHYELARCYRIGAAGLANIAAARMHLRLIRIFHRLLPGTLKEFREDSLIEEMDITAEHGTQAELKRLICWVQLIVPTLPAAAQTRVNAAILRYKEVWSARHHADEVISINEEKVLVTEEQHALWGLNLVNAGHGMWRWWSPSVRVTGEVVITQAVVEGITQSAVRVENTTVRYLGVKQAVPVVSGALYRLSGMARYAGPQGARCFYGRLACFIPGQPEHQLVWAEADPAWKRQACIITNVVTGTATVYVHLGFGDIISTGEFTDIRLQRANK